MLTLEFPGSRRLVDALDSAVGQREEHAITEALRKTLCALMRDRDVLLPDCVFERASDWFDIGEYAGGDVAKALRRIQVERACVIGVSTDILFPLTQQQQIADGLVAGGAEVDFVALDSPQGHDSFLVDIPRFGEPIARLLASL